MEFEIHGDRDCPVILTVSAADARRNELAKIAWRARMESGELPLIFLNPGDEAGDTSLSVWKRATVENSGHHVRLIELRSQPDDHLAIELALGAVDSAGRNRCGCVPRQVP